MIRHILLSKYGIEAEEERRFGNYEACLNNGALYTLVPINGMDEEELGELNDIVQHLVEVGDHQVAEFLPSRDGEIQVEAESGKYCILVNKQLRSLKRQQIGKKLGKFHHRGRAVQFTVAKMSRIGQWKTLWEKRLDQIEAVWNNMVYQQQAETEFDLLFLESFPYYLGMAENAIQYLVDTELDDEPSQVDSGTICHTRFYASTWSQEYFIKNPFDWVFDHCGRDLAEWTREKYFHNIKTYHHDIRQFFQEYQRITPLSSFSWRLIYARILFPLHYVECIEDYYLAGRETDKFILEEKLKKFLNQSKETEEFLAQFYTNLEVPIRRMNIPTVDWLAR